MDLARYHHDQADFYREEAEAAPAHTDVLSLHAAKHRAFAASLRMLAQHLDGVDDRQPPGVVAGRGMRSNDDGIPWERP